MRSRSVRAVATVAAATIAALLVAADLIHWRASFRHLGRNPGRGRREAVVVLGYGNKGDQINIVNQQRVRAGVRSQDRDRSSVLVLSGGAVAGPIPEAQLMARYAREVLHYAGELRVEPVSRSTWENIRHVIPLIEQADRIKIVSNSLHAELGRIYLHRQRPDLAARLVRARDHRFAEQLLLKPIMVVIGVRSPALRQAWTSVHPV